MSNASTTDIPIGPQPEHPNHHQLNPLANESASTTAIPSTPPQRANTNPPGLPEGNNNNNKGYLLGNQPPQPSATNNIPHQLDNKQIAELLRQQDPGFIRLVVPTTTTTSQQQQDQEGNETSAAATAEMPSEETQNKQQHQSNTTTNRTSVVTIYENPEQQQPTADELKQQRKVERIARHYGEEARDRGVAVPLIKPRYGPYRRNKESIRVSTNLTLGQQHNNASELLKSGGSFGLRPEKMVVQSGIQHYVDELHFDTPYAMFRTKDGKIETRSVGWSKRGDFVVERHDLILTSDYCYSDSDSAAAFNNKTNNNKNSKNLENFGKFEKPKRLAEREPSSSAAENENNNNNKNDNNDDDEGNLSSSTTQQQMMRTRKVLQVSHTRFEKPVCLDPAAPKPREVVSDGELRQASRGLWRRKYPGVRCPKNRKIRNRLMNDYFVTEHTRPMQLHHASSKNNRSNGAGGDYQDEDDDGDDQMMDDFERDMNLAGNKKKRSKRSKPFSFAPDALPSGFVEFADKTEKQQQQIMDRLMKGTNENNFEPFTSGGGLQNNSSMQNQNRRPDSDSAEGRWNSLPTKHKQEISHALTNTEFMPGFVRDVEQQIRDFLNSWTTYFYFNQQQTKNNKKQQQETSSTAIQKPDPYFDVLCRDGYGRLMVHILAQFYLLTSQSHDRVDGENENQNNTTNNKQQQKKGGKNNRQEFQRVTRVMLTSQKMKPPTIPFNTLCSLFSLTETPALTPKTPPVTFNVSGSNNKIGTPTSPGQQQNFSIGGAAIGTNNNSKKNSKKSSPIDQDAPTSIPVVNSRSPTAAANSSKKNVTSASASASNRFGSLTGKTKMNNDNDDSSASASSSEEGYDADDKRTNNNVQGNQLKRFRKKKTLQFAGTIRRKILPLLSSQ